MRIDFFTPVSFYAYDSNSVSERFINKIGSSLDHLANFRSERLSVYNKLELRTYEGKLVEWESGTAHKLIVNALKIAFWAMPLFAALAFDDIRVCIAAGVITTTAFLGKCAYRALHKFIYIQTPEEIISKAIEKYGAAAMQDANDMLLLTQIITGSDIENKHAEYVYTLYNVHAEKGHAESMYLLGNCLLEGYGCQAVQKEGIAWLKKAAGQNHEAAKKKVAELDNATTIPSLNKSQKGSLTPSEVKSIKATLEKSTSQKRLSLSPEDQEIEKKINKIYGRSGQAAISNPFQMLSIVNQIKKIDTKGTHKEEIFSLYLMHANKNHAESMYLVGSCYLDGEGCAKDMNEAVKWLKKAADKGNKKAHAILDEII